MKFFIVLITSILISLSVSAESIDQKKEELKKVYESGGITKTEYKKAMEFLENPAKEEKKEIKAFSLKKKKNKTNIFKKDKKYEENLKKRKKEKTKRNKTYKKIKSLLSLDG